MTDKSDQGLDNQTGGVKFGHHIVTLIDFLGQQRQLEKWDFLPETEYDTDEFVAAVRATFGKVTVWRDQFSEKFNLWLESRSLPVEFAKTLPDEGRAYREFAHTTLDFMQFSDTIVIYSPIVNQYGHANCGTVLAHLFTCGTLMLAALNQDCAFRGAIEIGMAGQIDEAGIYGPVLGSVHNLESTVAEYPRILVGDRLHEYLVAQAADPEDSRESKTNREIAKTCLRLIGIDLDQHRILDYMGRGFVEFATNKDSWNMLRDGACAFADQERERFNEAADQKLADRYTRMCEYHASRST
ncbi:MAG: hypothetical protein J5J06_15860 [Phycisphaerae bacterium]|nr:hypothetical protein [Phycisphaerae bacterium]